MPFIHVKVTLPKKFEIKKGYQNMYAVLAVAVDFSKAFNRQNHFILIQLLIELGVLAGC